MIDFELMEKLTVKMLERPNYSVVRSVEYNTTAIVCQKTTLVQLLAIDTMCNVLGTWHDRAIEATYKPNKYTPVYPTLKSINAGYYYSDKHLLFQFYTDNSNIVVGVYTIENNYRLFNDIGKVKTIKEAIELSENFLNSTLIWGEK